MKIEYKKLKGKCKNCMLGCYRLEDPEFTGIYSCEYYTEGEKNENISDRPTEI